MENASYSLVFTTARFQHIPEYMGDVAGAMQIWDGDPRLWHLLRGGKHGFFQTGGALKVNVQEGDEVKHRFKMGRWATWGREVTSGRTGDSSIWIMKEWVSFLWLRYLHTAPADLNMCTWGAKADLGWKYSCVMYGFKIGSHQGWRVKFRLSERWCESQALLGRSNTKHTHIHTQTHTHNITNSARFGIPPVLRVCCTGTRS